MGNPVAFDMVNEPQLDVWVKIEAYSEYVISIYLFETIEETIKTTVIAKCKSDRVIFSEHHL